MKIGAAIMIILLSFTTLGFLSSEYMHTRQTLDEYRQEVVVLEQRNQELSNQISESQQTIQYQEDEIQGLNMQVNSLQETIQAEQHKNLKAEQAQQQLLSEIAALQKAAEQNPTPPPTAKQSPIESTETNNLPQNKAQVAILLSLIAPIILGAIPLLRRVKNGDVSLLHSARPNNYVLLTDEEIRELIRKRNAKNSTSGL